jgi:hypothetical protein
VGLGYGKREWDDYEWFPSSGGRRGRAVLAEPGDPDGASAVLVERVLRDPIWAPDDAPRILLVDLDNLRAGPVRWRARMAVVVALARQADHVAMAGQEGAVRRARPHLEEFAGTAVAVAAGSDLADVALLAKVDELDLPDAQHLVVSNDGIFAELAQCGPLVVLSPGRDALSDSLAAASGRVIDLAALEHDLPTPARA